MSDAAKIAPTFELRKRFRFVTSLLDGYGKEVKTEEGFDPSFVKEINFFDNAIVVKFLVPETMKVMKLLMDFVHSQLFKISFLDREGKVLEDLFVSWKTVDLDWIDNLDYTDSDSWSLAIRLGTSNIRGER